MTYYTILIIAGIVDFLEYGFLNRFQSYFISIFTNSVEIQEYTQEILWIVLIVIVQDYLQGVLCGTIKALNK